MAQQEDSPIDVLIIEDDATIRSAVEYNLKSYGLSAASAATGTEGLVTADRLRPRVILLDIMLPGKDGYDLCHHIRTLNEDAAIVMMTALGTEPDKLKAFALGADDYITKPFAMSELTARVRAHLRRAARESGFDKKSLEVGDIMIDPVKHEVTVKGSAVDFRPKEFQLLAFLAANPNQIFSRQQLSDAVWGEKYVTSSRTIDVHIRHIRTKIEPRSDFNYIKTVHGLGYRFDPHPK